MDEKSQRSECVIRVLIADTHPIFLEGMAAILQKSTHPLFEAILASEKLLESTGIQRIQTPHLLWCRMTSEPRFIGQVSRLKRLFPSAQLVVIDEAPNDGRISMALRAGAKGYLSTNQSAEDIAAQLGYAARGEWAFSPIIAPRVRVTPKGAAIDRPFSAPSLAMLSPREREVMAHLAHGHSPRQCAELLGLAPSTIDNHKTRVMKKLRVHKSTQLVLLAVQLGLIDAGFAQDR